MQSWATGGLSVLTNVQLFDEGVDAPECEVVIDASPTQSITRYLQRAGRAMRPNGNKVALHLDLSGNCFALGLPQDTREWSLSDGELTDTTKSNPVPRVCEKCHTVFWGRTCPECQYYVEMAEVPEVETELEEATATTKKHLEVGRNRRQDVMRELAESYHSPDPEAAVIAIGEKRGYKPGWAQHILRARGLRV